MIENRLTITLCTVAKINGAKVSVVCLKLLFSLSYGCRKLKFKPTFIGDCLHLQENIYLLMRLKATYHSFIRSSVVVD